MRSPFSVTRRHVEFLFGDRLKHPKAPNREETVVRAEFISHYETQRELDNRPCRACGGDMLRVDFRSTD